MKRIFALFLAVLMLAALLCGCGNKPAAEDSKDAAAVSASDTAEAEKNDASDDKTDAAAPSDLPSSFEIAATDPHYTVATPDWHAEGYGCGFALNEDGNKDYAIVVACGSEATDDSLETAFETLYNDTFNGILMQNYRAKYAQFTPAATEASLADGSPALHFEDVQSADDYGTQLECPVYGYAFFHDGVPFIVACIVMNEDAVDEAKQAEMQGYVDEMINTVTTAQ